jgi:hypothetical protein
MHKRSFLNKIPIVLILRGGLGNQLSSILAAKVVAGAFGRYILVDSRRVTALRNGVDTSRDIFCLEFDRAFLNHLFFVKSINSKILSSIIYVYIYLCKCINYISWASKKLLLPNPAIDRISELRGLRSIYLDKHYEGADFARRYNSTNPKVEIALKNKSVEFLNAFSDLGKEGQDSIGIHIRLGDFRTWEGGKYLMPAAWYRLRLNEILSAVNNPMVFLFSDEPIAAEEYMIKDYPFLNISAKYAFSAPEELLLLSSCRFIIGSASSYSWWACFLKHQQENISFPIDSWALEEWAYPKKY